MGKKQHKETRMEKVSPVEALNRDLKKTLVWMSLAVGIVGILIVIQKTMFSHLI